MAVDYYGETALLRAVRSRLRNNGFEDCCDIEAGEEPPAVVGAKYVLVIPNGWTPGPTHNTSGGVADHIHSVRVQVIMRLPKFPKDRQREVFLANSSSLNSYVGIVTELIDWEYEQLINIANEFIERETGSTEGFIHPLLFAGSDPRPQAVGDWAFEAKLGEQRAGMQRGVTFGGARRMQTL